jgi:hypothetical protein
VEEKILDARLVGVSFSQLNSDQLRSATDQIMLKGAAISGCPTPLTEGFAEIIANELIIFINDYGYSNLTLKEILTAMRLNAAGGWKWPGGDVIERIEFSGACFNVTFISKVLYPYLVLRTTMDRKFQNKLDGHS